MRDSEVMERPGKGWTPWKEGPVYLEIDKVWWRHDSCILRNST